ncbi:MAG: rare lipoprotein, partial [Alphaproteobacteria bacterium]|nr:rare lipoprotein [Alphaproteobacteria bacterium]
SAMAAAAFVMSSALAAGETTSTSAQIKKLDQPASAISVAALDLPATGQNDAGAALAIDRAVSSPNEAVFETIIGAASFYDDPGETASGEQYDPAAFTAAAQLKIRDKFGGIKFGRLYQPSYGIAEYAGKKLIVKFNDVGPLRPGRMFDLSRAAMKYFDDSLDKGVLPDVKVTVLPLGRVYAAGPVTDAQLAELALGDTPIKIASVDPNALATSDDGQIAAAPASPVAELVQGSLACASASPIGPESHFKLAGLLEQGARQESDDRADAVMAEDQAAE